MAGGESGQLTTTDSSDDASLAKLDHPERVMRLRESMAESRRQIADSLDEIRDEFREATDWRGWVDQHPYEAVGIAFGIGFFLGFR